MNLFGKIALASVMASSLAMATIAASGTVSVVGNDFAQFNTISITGDAAKKLYQDLQIPETGRRVGSLFTNSKRGENIVCTFTAEVAQSYTCKMTIDSKGKALLVANPLLK